MLDNPDSWRIVGARNGSYGGRCGLVAHRGVLHPDDYVDQDVLRALVEHELGFTYEQARSVYRGRGRRTAAQMALRARIDARFYDIRRAGGNLELLARVIGIDRKKVIGGALGRARHASQAGRSDPGACAK